MAVQALGLLVLGVRPIQYWRGLIQTSVPFETEVNTIVRFTYNEASNAIITVTGSASHMRGSEFCQRKQLCPGYRPMGLSKNSAY